MSPFDSKIFDALSSFAGNKKARPARPWSDRKSDENSGEFLCVYEVVNHHPPQWSLSEPSPPLTLNRNPVCVRQKSPACVEETLAAAANIMQSAAAPPAQPTTNLKAPRARTAYPPRRERARSVMLIGFKKDGGTSEKSVLRPWQ